MEVADGEGRGGIGGVDELVGAVGGGCGLVLDAKPVVAEAVATAAVWVADEDEGGVAAQGQVGEEVAQHPVEATVAVGPGWGYAVGVEDYALEHGECAVGCVGGASAIVVDGGGSGQQTVGSGQCGEVDDSFGAGADEELEPLDVGGDDAGEFAAGVGDVGSDAVLGLPLAFEALA